MCKSFTSVGSLTPPLHLASPLAPSCSFVLPASLIRVDDLNFGFLAQVFCVVEVGVSTSATAAALGEARGSPTEEGITLTVVHHMRIAQQDDLGICHLVTINALSGHSFIIMCVEYYFPPSPFWAKSHTRS